MKRLEGTSPELASLGLVLGLHQPLAEMYQTQMNVFINCSDFSICLEKIQSAKDLPSLPSGWHTIEVIRQHWGGSVRPEAHHATLCVQSNQLFTHHV